MNINLAFKNSKSFDHSNMNVSIVIINSRTHHDYKKTYIT